MSMLSRQRRICEELALAVRADRDELGLARARLLRRLRERIASPGGLAAFFVAGLLVGRLALGGARSRSATGGGTAPGPDAGSRRRWANASVWGLRLLELLAKL